MTEWSPIQSVIIWMINKLGLLQNRRLICLSWVWLQTKLDDKNSLPINQNYDKIWDGTRHLLYVFMKKNNSHLGKMQDNSKCTWCILSTYIGMVFYCPFNCAINNVQLQAWSIHHPITAQMGQVITNHVPEFCHSFDYKLKRTEQHHNEQMKKMYLIY